MKKRSIVSRFSARSAASALLGGLLCLATLSGCGIARRTSWFRTSAPTAPPSEPQGGYVPSYGPSQAPVQREYSPAPTFEQTPAPPAVERPTPIFPNDPPPPSTSEYLSPPPHQRETVPGQPQYGERPGLISPRNARRLPQGSERPAAAEVKQDSEPSFKNGPVASRGEFRHLLTRFQQTSAGE